MYCTAPHCLLIAQSNIAQHTLAWVWIEIDSVMLWGWCSFVSIVISNYIYIFFMMHCEANRWVCSLMMDMSVSHVSGSTAGSYVVAVTAGWCHPVWATDWEASSSERRPSVAKHSSVRSASCWQTSSQGAGCEGWEGGRGGGGELIWTITKSRVLCWAALKQQARLMRGRLEKGEGGGGRGRRGGPLGFVVVQQIDEREQWEERPWLWQK